MSKHKPMNPEWKAKWLEALRSGEYKQCDGAMITKDGYCCLGVLREIMYKNSRASNRGYLADKHAEEVGISPHVVGKRDTQEILADKNDDGQSFKKIANWIEKNL